MKFLKFSPLCSRCHIRPRGKKSLRNSSTLPNGRAVAGHYCDECQGQLTLGPTARALDARHQLWPSERRKVA